MLVSLLILWAQFLLTARWSAVDGSLHGPKQAWFVAALVIATLAIATDRARTIRPVGRAVSTGALFAGALLLVVGFVGIWFPPATWTGVPYLDNWAPRYQSTLEGIALLTRGAAVGWNWSFLGGYHTASDASQNLALIAFVPVLVFGAPLGFHLLHALLLVALPALVYLDLRLEGDRRRAALAAGLVCFTTAGFSYLLFRSGDTNSLAGAVLTYAVLVAAHAAAAGRRWGGPMMVIGLVGVGWSHAGFVIYALLFLVVDAALTRDARRVRRAIVAAVAGGIGTLPVTWELWRYPSYFLPNNILVDPAYRTDWLEFARKIYYNVELLWLPGRWFNDFSGLTNVLLPVLAIASWRLTGRTRVHAASALVVVLLLRLNTPEFAYIFLRPIHLLAVFTPVALAGFLCARVSTDWRRASVVLLACVYLQVWWHEVPHVAGLDRVQPDLVAHLREIPDAMVLFENVPHRDMDRDPSRTTEAPPVPVHFEAFLPVLTGKRFYAGMWDGWQWCPQRDRVLAGGAFRGVALDRTPPAVVRDELAQWGVRRAIVWSAASKAYFAGQPGVTRRWDSGPWTDFEIGATSAAAGAAAIAEPDTRDVVTATGRGALEALTPLGGRVRLDAVRAGDVVVVRTSYYPAWTALAFGQPVALRDQNGQLAFDAPREGSYDVELRYPRRTWLLVVAAIGTMLGAVVALRVD